PPPSRSPLFPYTTLFRSKARYGEADLGKGPTVTRGANINPIVFSMIREAAKTDDIPIQVSAEPGGTGTDANAMQLVGMATGLVRSEEHTSELQSRENLVC